MLEVLQTIFSFCDAACSIYFWSTAENSRSCAVSTMEEGRPTFTTILTTRCSQPLNFQTLGFFTIAELVELALHLDVVDWGGRGIVPDRRDLGAMEEQDEDSKGRRPNLSFEERESFFSNGQFRLLCCSVLEKAC